MSDSDLPPCHCLLEPGTTSEMDARDRDIAAKVQQFGWSSQGVSGMQSPPWAYSIGLWHTFRAPEVCIFGLPPETGMRVVNVLGDLVRDGVHLTPGRRDDVLTGYDVILGPARPEWYPSFFGAALDFQTGPPLPIVQAFWPDREGRFPWDDGADDACRDDQPMLWLPPAEHPAGKWSDFDPYAGWPFGTSLPYFTARASPSVVEGAAPITCVIRAADGAWTFTDGATGPAATTTLRDVLTTNPHVAGVADLAAGRQADLLDGAWVRT